jgi:hypothetical protein
VSTRHWVLLAAAVRAMLPLLLIDPTRAALCPYGLSVVFSHDQKFHIELAPRKAIEQHRIGCFYLWGANDTKWEKLCCFVRSHAAIVRLVHSTPRPFIYHVAHNCRLTRVQMP